MIVLTNNDLYEYGWYIIEEVKDRLDLSNVSEGMKKSFLSITPQNIKVKDTSAEGIDFHLSPC